jgi:hypothetical protein
LWSLSIQGVSSEYHGYANPCGYARVRVRMGTGTNIRTRAKPVWKPGLSKLDSPKVVGVIRTPESHLRGVPNIFG